MRRPSVTGVEVSWGKRRLRGQRRNARRWRAQSRSEQLLEFGFASQHDVCPLQGLIAHTSNRNYIHVQESIYEVRLSLVACPSKLRTQCILIPDNLPPIASGTPCTLPNHLQKPTPSHTLTPSSPSPSPNCSPHYPAPPHTQAAAHPVAAHTPQSRSPPASH